MEREGENDPPRPCSSDPIDDRWPEEDGKLWFDCFEDRLEDGSFLITMVDGLPIPGLPVISPGLFMIPGLMSPVT